VSKLNILLKPILLCIFIYAFSNCLAQAPPSSSTVPKEAGTVRKNPFFKTGGGYLSYNWSYRSGVDSSVSWNNISQHLTSIGFRAVFAKTVPVMITYVGRQSNSPYFKDFHDVRVDVDVQQYRQLRWSKALENLTGYKERMHDTLLSYAMNVADKKSNHFKDLANDPGVIQKLIRCRETLVRNDFSDTSARYRDSMIAVAKQFIQYYDTLQINQKKYEALADSLKQVYEQSEKRIQRAKLLLSGKPLSAAELEELTDLYGKNDKGIKQLRKARDGIRSLSFGRTLPDFSGLTVQNVNVNGASVEYTHNNIYMAAVAGIVDFRIRDFLYQQQKPARQYLYAARVGYGTKEKDNIILTYFKGRKQLFGGSLSNKAAEIQGVSVAGQFYIYKGVKIHGELAQSGIPYLSSASGVTHAKPSIRLNDRSQSAYSVGFNAYIPETQSSAEGYYRHSGLNYQSFNSFQYNAAASSWAFGLTQSFWKRVLTLQINFRKNDFVNPLILQRYDANTIYKNVAVTFNKNKWPLISVGYMPASQYTAVGNQVYENHYQSFTVTIRHQYKIGLAKASSLLLFSRFYNDSRDSGFIYYNSSNFFLSQVFHFTLFSTTLNIARMKNGDYDHVVMEEGVSANLFQKVNAGFAIKINNLNRLITKVGFSANTRINLKHVGELNVWMEQSYLPSSQADLFKYESYNIGLTKYF